MHTTGRTHQGRGARPACAPGSQQRELTSPLAFLCGGSFGAAPVLPLTQFPERRGGSRQVVLETSYSVQTGGRGSDFQSGDQAEPGPPPPPVAAGWPLGPQPGQLSPPAATWAPRAGERLLLRLPDLVVASPR